MAKPEFTWTSAKFNVTVEFPTIENFQLTKSDIKIVERKIKKLLDELLVVKGINPNKVYCDMEHHN